MSAPVHPLTTKCCVRCGHDCISQRLYRQCAALRRRYRSLCARGLCVPCYEWAQRAGTLADYPRKQWAREELLTEYQILRREGYNLRLIADRLEISRGALERALIRAAGDPRAHRPTAAGIRRTG